MAGARRGQATAVTCAPASCAAIMRWYDPLATVASVASRPMRRVRLLCTAAWLSAVITPITGTSRWVCRWASAAAVAVLQATTIIFTSWASSQPAIASARARRSSADLSPYGNQAVSPK